MTPEGSYHHQKRLTTRRHSGREKGYITQAEFLAPHINFFRFAGAVFFEKLTIFGLLYRFILCAFLRYLFHSRGNITIDEHENLQIIWYIYLWIMTFRVAIIYLIGIKYHDLTNIIMQKPLDKRYLDLSCVGNQTNDSIYVLLKDIILIFFRTINKICLSTFRKVSLEHRTKRFDILRLVIFVIGQLITWRNVYFVYSGHFDLQLEYYYRKQAQQFKSFIVIPKDVVGDSSSPLNWTNYSMASIYNSSNHHINDLNSNQSTNTSNYLYVDQHFIMPYLFTILGHYIRSISVFFLTSILYSLTFAHNYGHLYLYLFITATTSDMLASGYKHDLEYWMKTINEDQYYEINKASSFKARRNTSSKLKIIGGHHQTGNGHQESPDYNVSLKRRRGPLLTTKLLIHIRDMMIILRNTMSLAYLLTYFCDIFTCIYFVYVMTITKGTTRHLAIIDFLAQTLNMFNTRIGHYLLYKEVNTISKDLADLHNSTKNMEHTNKETHKNNKNRPRKVMFISESEMITINRLAHDISHIGPTDWFEPDLVNVVNSILFAITFVGTFQQLMGTS